MYTTTIPPLSACDLTRVVAVRFILSCSSRTSQPMDAVHGHHPGGRSREDGVEARDTSSCRRSNVDDTLHDDRKRTTTHAGIIIMNEAGGIFAALKYFWVPGFDF